MGGHPPRRGTAGTRHLRRRDCDDRARRQDLPPRPRGARSRHGWLHSPAPRVLLLPGFDEYLLGTAIGRRSWRPNKPTASSPAATDCSGRRSSSTARWSAPGAGRPARGRPSSFPSCLTRLTRRCSQASLMRRGRWDCSWVRKPVSPPSIPRLAARHAEVTARWAGAPGGHWTRRNNKASWCGSSRAWP